MKMKTSLQEILLILAEFYKYPDEAFFESIQSGNLEKEWNKHGTFMNILDNNIVWKHSFDSLEHMKMVHKNCFIGPNKPFFPPIESLYKKWTDDPTAAIPIAHKTGYLFGDPAIHMQHLYKEYQLEIPEHFKNMPDHLGLQVEFLAFLIKYSTMVQVEQYLNDHFDWLDTFKNNLQLVNDSDFYVCITNQLIKVVEFMQLEANNQRKIMEGV